MPRGLLTFAVAGLAGGYAALAALGAWRWSRRTRSLIARLDDAARASGARGGRVDLRRTDALPEPVRRYLRTVLRDGQPLIGAADFAHEGEFDLGGASPRWRRFVSRQRMSAPRPGFVWDARIDALPGVPLRVHDAYVDGAGELRASLLGLATLAAQRGSPGIAQGELMRFAAEAPMVPTALLPGEGVRWRALDGDEHAAELTLSDGDVSATLRFGFSADGLVETVYAPARERSVGGALVPTPWQGRWWDYELRSGMLVPTRGEVAWLLPDGPRPYWRGRLAGAAYTALPR